MVESIQFGDICLRPIEERDLPLMVKWRGEPEVAKYMFSSDTFTLERQKEWFAKVSQDPRWCGLIIEVEESTAIGVVALKGIDRLLEQAEFGIYIGELQYRGKGLGKHAIGAAKQFAFDNLNLRRLYLRVFADNKIAIEVYKKCGFQIEKVLKDSQEKDGESHDVVVMTADRNDR